MSPHAVRPDPSSPLSESLLLDLCKHGVTRNGFLPAEAPCQLLSDPYYQPWELVARRLPELIDSGGIRDAVRKLPVLSTDSLRTEAERRRAYVMLAYMSQAYVWGGERPEEVRPLHYVVGLIDEQSPKEEAIRHQLED